MNHENLEQLPKLLPGEEVISIEEMPDEQPTRPPSSIEAIWRLTGAASSQEVGEFGPSLASLPLDEDEDKPEKRLYEAVFGRDSLRVAMDLIDRHPKLARATILKLATLQGVKTDLHSEEEPGRIVHEFRDPAVDPIAREITNRRKWAWPYYGSVDSTPEFVRALALYSGHTEEGELILKESFMGRDGRQHSIADSLQAAVYWIGRRLSANPDGLLEYKQAFPGGTENQVWRDSPDAYFHADGSLANNAGGIASLDVQRVTYDALLDAADLYEHSLGLTDQAVELRKKANHLRGMIMNHFWTEDDGGFFVLGTDRDPDGNIRQLTVKTSDMGHLLHSRLLMSSDSEVVKRREAVVRHLFSSSMLGLNGIRTLAEGEVRYRPEAYHNGSVWIWDNYLISQGLTLHGYYGLAAEVNKRLLDDINTTHRFPEYLRGDSNPSHRLNTRTVKIWDNVNNFENPLEQPPQDVQAWSAAAILSIKLRSGEKLDVAPDPAKLRFEASVLRDIEAV